MIVFQYIMIGGLCHLKGMVVQCQGHIKVKLWSHWFYVILEKIKIKSKFGFLSFTLTLDNHCFLYLTCLQTPVLPTCPLGYRPGGYSPGGTALTPHPQDRTTYTCENITFPQLGAMKILCPVLIQIIIIQLAYVALVVTAPSFIC